MAVMAPTQATLSFSLILLLLLCFPQELQTGKENQPVINVILQNNVTLQSQTTENQTVITSQSNNLQNKNTTLPTFSHKTPKKRDYIPHK